MSGKTKKRTKRRKKPGGRAQAMWEGNATCMCGSSDIRLITNLGTRLRNWDRARHCSLQPLFGCGKCKNTWTSGDEGYPFMRVAVPDPDWK